MHCKITELSCKEVINVCDGTRYGYVNDVEVDCSCGKITALIVHGKRQLNTIFSKNCDIIIPWEAIKRIGDDLILTDFAYDGTGNTSKSGFFKSI